MRFVFWLLLGVIFVASLGLLFHHVATVVVVPPVPPVLDYTAIGELLLVAVLALEGLVAVSHLSVSRLDRVHESVVKMFEDYRSPEMLLAVHTLKTLRNEHPNDFREIYVQTWEEDKKRVSAAAPADKLAIIRGSLHCHRRSVKLFYELLAGLYELGTFPKHVVFRYWTEDELRIIPDVIMPLEERIAQVFNSGPALEPTRRRLNRLYQDSRSYGNWKSRLTPISPPRVKSADLLRPVVVRSPGVGSPSATAESKPDRVLLQCCLRFQRWRNLDEEAAPNTY